MLDAGADSDPGDLYLQLVSWHVSGSCDGSLITIRSPYTRNTCGNHALATRWRHSAFGEAVCHIEDLIECEGSTKASSARSTPAKVQLGPNCGRICLLACKFQANGIDIPVHEQLQSRQLACCTFSANRHHAEEWAVCNLCAAVTAAD